ncbi:methyl-accepting chemotaxis protein [Chrysiogenes arsenatis]|uniref:methyl-accepting chemotaxis protein n=1 Tax=Chrysiogenes arsenatis TaxID=309797 RepID=UPI000486CFD2|nr:methyl-accepting chemotaxis protein [Chrysiogenes arsenatis]
MRVVHRQMVLVFSFVVFLVVVGGIGLSSMKESQDGLHTVYHDRVVPLRDLKQISDLYAINIVDATHKSRNANISMAAALKLVENAEEAIAKLWSGYLATELVAEETRLIDQIRPLMPRAEASIQKLKKILYDSDGRALAAFANDELYQVVEPLTDKFAELIEVQLNVARVEYESAQSRYERNLWLTIGLLLGAIVVGVLIAGFITRTIVGPLNHSVDFATAVSQGDLTRTLPVKQRDEVGLLVLALNRMVESLRATVEQIHETATGVASASEELSSASVQMSSGMSLQAERVSQIASASTEMAQTSSAIAGNMNTIQQSTVEALELSREGGQKVKLSAKEMISIAQQVAEASNYARSLEEKAGRVQEVIRMIDDIAEQTNLLALNAAIEAARAGDAGRGFAVVADEVRKLAERSAQSTSEINTIVVSMQGGVDQVVSSMDLVNTKAQNGNVLAQETDAAFAEIIGGMETLQELIIQNAASVEEMSVTADQITEDIQAIASASEQTARSSEEVSRASSDLAALASDVQQSVSFFQVSSPAMVARR